MDTSQPTVVIPKNKESSASPQRQRRSVAEKRRMVEETLIPGASVARVARLHGVNANQLFGWRRLYLSGRLGERKPGIQLLRVRVSESKPASVALEPINNGHVAAARPQAGAIYVELRQAQIRIEGNADPVLVRVLLECLRA